MTKYGSIMILQVSSVNKLEDTSCVYHTVTIMIMLIIMMSHTIEGLIIVFTDPIINIMLS